MTVVRRTASALQDADLARILDAVPCLHPSRYPGSGPRTMERVPGGLTNVNVKLTLAGHEGQAGQVMIARIATDDSTLLAIDRDAEHANSVSAARAGAAPAVICRSAQAGVLVVRWVEGRTLAAADLRDDANLPRIAQACRRLHDGPAFSSDFDIFEVQRRYLNIVQQKGFRLPVGYLDRLPAFASIETALAVRPQPTVPCHNDLLAENFVDDGDRLWLIDFEYSGNNEACFELGNLAAESDLSLAQLTELVRLYFGGVDHTKVARARLFAVASWFGWTLWGVIQGGASTLDFDFWAWGTAKYERAIAEFDGPDFGRLLEEVTADA